MRSSSASLQGEPLKSQEEFEQVYSSIHLKALLSYQNKSTRAKLIFKGSLTCHIMIWHVCLRFRHPENLPTVAGVEPATSGLHPDATGVDTSVLQHQF
ncbi:hypothetical protein TNCV_3285331 [Trichonephila clavipes]|nr:hypothetical protein TNCV_3285331 [Trichonephila clavipes]